MKLTQGALKTGGLALAKRARGQTWQAGRAEPMGEEGVPGRPGGGRQWEMSRLWPDQRAWQRPPGERK